jgi:integrase
MPRRLDVVATEFHAAVTGGIGPDAAIAGMGLEVLLEAWSEAVGAQVCRATADTYALYARRHFVPFFETLDRIKPPRVAEYTRARLGEVKRRTLLKELSALRGFLAWCVEVGHLAEAPRVPSPPARAQGHAVHDRRVVELEAEEVAAILAHLPERGRGGSRPRAFYELMWETGLRTGTLARLSVPEDFERGRRVLTIRDEIDKARFGRELPLTARAVTVLDAIAPKRGLVFGQRDLRDALRRAARAAGLSAERAAVGDAAGGDGSEEPPAAHRDAPQNSGEIVVRNALSEMNSGSCDGGRNSPNSLSLRKAGLEPARVLPRWNLNPVRLPIPPLPRGTHLSVSPPAASKLRTEGALDTLDRAARQGRARAIHRSAAPEAQAGRRRRCRAEQATARHRGRLEDGARPGQGRRDA